ncbi:hypothetical protein LEP1GSC195_1678 [Leptospira wolbachii serovar Codice str. CDC]|uniref:Uncharacterized protein n=1 Tax=Leptospira wolbachii serovar Codice str. CDC TaxID=1218599 RepID=R9A8A7_9LEPT|nr:hypothetical protein LEP1GSC195_1678 [Leptospira wolbachii serovar Codice str. CDC]
MDGYRFLQQKENRETKGRAPTTLPNLWSLLSYYWSNLITD